MTDNEKTSSENDLEKRLSKLENNFKEFVQSYIGTATILNFLLRKLEITQAELEEALAADAIEKLEKSPKSEELENTKEPPKAPEKYPNE